MKTDYDIIIIGSGAGGGTLARHLAPSGKSILHPRARRLAYARAGELERGGSLRKGPLRLAEHMARQERKALPAGHASLTSAARQRCMARRCFACAKEDFERLRALRRHVAGVADELRGLRALLHQGRGDVPGARHRAAKTRPSRPRSAPYPVPPVSHEPRIQKLSDDLAKAGYHPFHTPCGIMLNEANMPFSTCVRCKDCDGFPCLVHAKSDAEVVGVRPALQHPNVDAGDQRAGLQAQHQCGGHRRHRSRGRTSTASSDDLHAAASWSSRAARRTRRSCC